jgi:hypothetical protein
MHAHAGPRLAGMDRMEIDIGTSSDNLHRIFGEDHASDASRSTGATKTIRSLNL